MSVPISGVGGTSPISSVDGASVASSLNTSGPLDKVSKSLQQPPSPSVGGSVVPLPGKVMSILEFSNILSSAMLAFKNSICDSVMGNLLVSQALKANESKFGIALQQLLSQYKNAAEKLAAVTNEANQVVDDHNASLLQYTNSLAGTRKAEESFVNQMNALIEQYNNGTINQATFEAKYKAGFLVPGGSPQESGFQNVLNYYNTLNNNATAAYNKSIEVYNNALVKINQDSQDMNATLSPLGIPSFDTWPKAQSVVPPYQISASSQLLGPPFKAPLEHIVLPPLPSLPPLDHIITPSVSEFILTFFLSSSNTLLQSANLAEVRSEYFEEFIAHVMASAKKLLSYKPPVSASAHSSGSTSVGSIAMTLGLNTPGASPMTKTVFSLAEAMESQNRKLLPNKDDYNSFQQNTLIAASLQAAIPALASLGLPGLASKEAQSAFGVTFAISYAQVIGRFVDQNQGLDAIRQMIENNAGGNVDEHDLARFTNVFNAGLNQQLLQTALLVGARTMGAPGLPLQTLANLQGMNEQLLQQPLSANEVLQDPIKQLFIRNILTSAIAQDQLMSAAQASAAVDLVLGPLVNKTPVNGFEALGAAVYAGFNGLHFNDSLSRSLSELTVSLIRQEASAMPLTNSAALSTESVENSLQKELKNSGIGSVQAQAIAQEVAGALLSSVFTNTAEYQIKMGSLLKSLGIKDSDEIARAATAMLTTVGQEIPPLMALKSSKIVPHEQLGNDLASHVQRRLPTSIGANKAMEICNEASRTFFGVDEQQREPSIFALLDRTENQLEKMTGTKGREASLKSHQMLVACPFDLFAITNKILDPAYAFQKGFSIAADKTSTASTLTQGLNILI